MALIIGAIYLLFYHRKVATTAYHKILFASVTPIEPYEMLPEYQDLVQEYPNFAGWISIYGHNMRHEQY